MTKTAADREFSLDAARGTLMALGILLHAANIFAFGGNWLVADTEKSMPISLVAGLIHEFRMPTFFWLSGYFAALSFQKAGVKGLLYQRLPRLAIPLVVGWLTLNLIQKIASALLAGQNTSEALLNGIPVYHLWFLIDLLIFIAVAALLLPLVLRPSTAGQRSMQIPALVIVLALPLLSVAFNAAARATGFAYVGPWGLTSLGRLALYAPFFVAGALMRYNQDARALFLRTPLWLFALALPLAVYIRMNMRSDVFWATELLRFVELALIWISEAGVLRLFNDFVKKDSPVTRFVSDSAYTIFLFHHLIVFALGVALLDYPLGAWVKFSIISVVAYLLCCAIHVLVIRRSRLASLLFNGK